MGAVRVNCCWREGIALPKDEHSAYQNFPAAACLPTVARRRAGARPRYLPASRLTPGQSPLS